VGLGVWTGESPLLYGQKGQKSTPIRKTSFDGYFWFLFGHKTSRREPKMSYSMDLTCLKALVWFFVGSNPVSDWYTVSHTRKGAIIHYIFLAIFGSFSTTIENYGTSLQAPHVKHDKSTHMKALASIIDSTNLCSTDIKSKNPFWPNRSRKRSGRKTWNFWHPFLVCEAEYRSQTGLLLFPNDSRAFI
jgi:hypothetical protein